MNARKKQIDRDNKSTALWVAARVTFAKKLGVLVLFFFGTSTFALVEHYRVAPTFDTASWAIHHCYAYGKPRTCPRAYRHRITSSVHAGTSITLAAGRLASRENCFITFQPAFCERWLARSRYNPPINFPKDC